MATIPRTRADVALHVRCHALGKITTQTDAFLTEGALQSKNNAEQ